MDTKPQTIFASMLRRLLNELKDNHADDSTLELVGQMSSRLEGRLSKIVSLLDTVEQTGPAIGFDEIYETLRAHGVGKEILDEMEEARSVILALRQFRDDIDILMSRLDDKRTFTRSELEDLRASLTVLKAELAAAAKRGTVEAQPTLPNQFEVDYFGPAVRAASANLRARVNSHPLSGQWYSSLYGARMDITHPLDGLEAQFPNF